MNKVKLPKLIRRRLIFIASNLFNEFKIIKVRNKGPTLILQRGIFCKKYRWDILTVCLRLIPEQISVERHGTYSFTKYYVDDLIALSGEEIEYEDWIIKIINYLYFNFIEIELRKHNASKDESVKFDHKDNVIYLEEHMESNIIPLNEKNYCLIGETENETIAYRKKGNKINLRQYLNHRRILKIAVTLVMIAKFTFLTLTLTNQIPLSNTDNNHITYNCHGPPPHSDYLKTSPFYATFYEFITLNKTRYLLST